MKRTTSLKYVGLTMATAMFTTQAQADNVIVDDLIVDGSACIGQDCVNGESFGFDTLRLKENNLRIGFQDTSTSASFPSRDWRIVANDSSNGGSNYLGIEDVDSSRIPFRVEGGAPAHSVFIEDSGHVGLGTNNPVVELHVVDGDSPTLRLEQDGSSGFTPQTFDIAGNESNFFVRDVTNGSTLPFRIEPSAPTNALYVDSTGNIGLGTTNPSEELEIVGDADNVKFLMRTTDTTEVGLQFNRKDDEFRISDVGDVDLEFVLTDAGNLTISGALTENSDKNNKMAIEPISHDDILNKVAALEVSRWTYKHDAESGIRHIGPMAQDFYALFGTGASEKGISTIDTAGVALAAVQGLLAQNSSQAQLISDLSARIEALEAVAQ